MTSFCNTPQPTKSWQQLIADCLGDETLYQRQDGDLDSDISTSDKSDQVYWVDDLSVPAPPSSPWQYHTALAIGATVVCSAGALMQHTETGFWHPPEDSASNDNTATVTDAESAAAEADVSTPPIASPQASSSVAFSSGAGERDTTCKDSTCKGLEFIDQQVPQIQEQVRALRSEMQMFQAKHTTQNLQTHRTVLAYRSSDLSHRQAELTVRSQQLQQKLSNVTSILALDSDEVNYISHLLVTDRVYQEQLQQLKALETDIAVEFSNPDLDNTQLGELYAAYYQLEGQLRQTAQVILADYAYVASLQSPDPLWQEAAYEAPLQELMDISHHRQMLVIEQQTLDQIAKKLTERRTELATLLRQYAVMQRELDGHNQVLQQYVAERQELTSELT
ncbi:hypothetical protein SPB21_30790 [Leptothoe sp. ISB3NOV94-8A]